jgi:protein SDA1
MLSDLRSANSKTTNHKLNRSMQTTLYNLVASEKTTSKGLWSVKFTRELWKRQIWTDSKAVDIMKEAALSENPKVIIGGVKFFLGSDREREEAEDSSSGEEGINMGALRHQMGINKKTKKRARDLRQAAATVKKKERKSNQTHQLNFSALHLINDPQGFAEALFTRHVQSGKSALNLEQKLQVLSLVCRLVGLHQLTIESLYSYFLKYLTPRQESVTTFLACLSMASHNLVPPDLLTPLVWKIANEFVSEAAASEVASVGLNSIREICVRQPLAMEEMLLQDLVQYRKSKDKGVMMAAKGLLSLFRNVGAEMLHRRDRGKDASMGLRRGDQAMARFGEVHVDDDIVGIELLEAHKEEERLKRVENGELDDDLDEDARIEKEDAEGWRNWDVESDNSDDSGSWHNVSSDGEEDFHVTDSEDEKPSKKKLKKDTTAKSPAADEVATPGSTTTTATDRLRSNFATTRILTPADLAKLRELQQTSAVTSTLTKRKSNHQKVTAGAPVVPRAHPDDEVTVSQLEGLALMSYKATKEEKIARARGDKDEKHLSTTMKRKEKKSAAGKSTTNREKERQKNFLMTLGKAKRKGRRSLKEVRQVMRGHVERGKKGGRRGNKGE